MLAMLSCVFFEPASTLSNANAVLHKDDEVGESILSTIHR